MRPVAVRAGRVGNDAPMSPWSTSTIGQDELIGRPAQLLGSVLGEELPDDAVRSVYQPIVDLDGQAVVGFEALTRGPAGTDLASPLALFDLMRREGHVADFDRACRDAALARARRDGVQPPCTVFVNVEPDLVEEPWEVEEQHTWVEAPGELRCCIEITERDLTARPAQLLHAVARVRAASWGVALDDVGADHRSLALLALLRPDVIKLDMRMVQGRPDREIAEVVGAVNAQAQETGALVLAEGIETERHLRIAMALGARLGQGYAFGRPEDLPDTPPASGPAVRFLGGDLHAHGPAPFALVRERMATRRADAPLVRGLIEHLEQLAMGLGPATVVLGAQSEERFRNNGAGGIVALAAQAALVGMVGVAPREGMTFRGGAFDPRDDDGLEAEWTLCVLAPHFAAAVVARQVGSGPPDEATYEFAVTHERALVAACARSLAARLAPAG
jgi:EAL domain-containing protein (putative c-di-GMP-specific phosphodiesterase class I)